MSTTSSNAQLTSVGTLDWIDWGNSGAPGTVRKNATNYISAYSLVGSGTVGFISTDTRKYTWTDGTPITSNGNGHGAVTVAGVGNGFQVTVPADAQSRTVLVYVSGQNSGATFSAHLSDGSAADYTNTVNFSSSYYLRLYTITYQASGPGKTLTLKWTSRSSTGTVNLNAVALPTFNYVNHAPTISAPNSLTTVVGGAVSLPVVGADPDGDTLVYSATNLPAGLTINPSTGVISGTPTTSGTYNVTVSTRDPGNLNASSAISWTIGSAADSNTAPSVASATFAAALNSTVTVTPSWTDPDNGDTFTLSLVTQPAHGTVSIDGLQFIYTPAVDYVGPDSFTFRVTDNHLASTTGVASGTVSAAVPDQVIGVAATQGTQAGRVTVTWPPSAYSSSYEVYRGTSATDPSPVLLTSGSATSYADTSASPGVVYYYKVRGTNPGGPGPLSVATSGFADTPPASAAATFAAGMNQAVVVTPTWTDPDSGDSGTLVVLTQPAHGTAVVSGAGFTYTPTTGYVGSDSFTFSVTDRAGASVSGTASGTITAPDPSPVVTVSASQGTVVGAVQLVWSASANAFTYNVLRGSSANDPSPVPVSAVTGTSYSDATVAAGLQYYYSIQAAAPGKTAAASAPALGYADTPPSAASAAFAATLETPVVVTPTWTDPDSGDSGSLVVATQPAHGTAVVSGLTITYTPVAAYVGPDSFTFTVTDRAGATATGTASGTVTALDPSPVVSLTATQGTRLASVDLAWTASANARSYIVQRGASASDPSPVVLGTVNTTSYSDASAVPGQPYYYSVVAAAPGKTAAASASVLGYADTPPSAATATFAATLETAVVVTPTWTDPDAGDTGSLVVATQPSHGTAVVSGLTITYTPAAGYVGPDAFTFTVTDRAGATATGTASGTVTAVDPSPVVSLTATQGTRLSSVDLAWTASENARSYIVQRGASASDPSPVVLGTVNTTAYSDASAVPGQPYYYSVVSAAPGKTAAASASVLGYADTPPSAASASFAATLETPVVVTPTWTDPDSGDSGSLVVATQPAHGTAVVSGLTITYTPAAGYVGADSFTFTVTDRAGATATGTASGTVTALDPSPVVSLTATQGTRLASVDLAWTASANARSYIVQRGASASDPSPVVLGTVNTTSYSDASAVPGQSYYYSVVAAAPGKTAAASSTVLGFADTAPSAAAATFTTSFGTTVSISPTFNDPDPGDTATFAIVTAPAHGTALVTGTTIQYTPAPGYVGSDSFSFRVTDRAGASIVGTAAGTVMALAPDPISGLTASQGTSLNRVNLAWNASINASSYSVFRSTSLTDPAPTLLATIAGLSFTDTTAAAGTSYFYFVQPKNASLDGAMSAGVQGSTDTPPTAASGAFSTLEGQSVTFMPTWIDNDPGDTFALSIVSGASHGVVSVVNNQLVYTPTAGYVGLDEFQFSVTDRAGASVTGLVSGTVAPGVPDAPLGFVVSQGTTIGSVELAWANTIGSIQYLVSRSEATADPSADTIATVSTNAFSDRNATPGVTYYYRIRAVGVAGVSAFSKEVSGYADTPPSAAFAATSTVFNTPVTFAPTVSDPDPGEAFTLLIKTPPGHGSVALTPDAKQFVYTPTPGFAGSDSFSFAVTDMAGASVDGTATVGVGCPAPAVMSLAISQPKVFAGSGFTVAGAYGNTGCPGSLTGTLTVKSGTTTVYQSPAVTLAGAVSAPLSFAVDSLQAGSYVLDVTVVDSVTGNVAHSNMPLAVASYRMPTFSASSKVFANLDTATVGIGSSPDCTLTEVRSEAIANHALCYFEVVPQPPGLVRDTAASLPTWSGKVTVAGIYRPVFAVYQYDDAGVPKVLGTAERTMDVQPLDSMQFSSPASVQTAQYMQQATINVSQTAGAPCQITTDRVNAVTGTSRGTRMCFLEFTPNPPYSTLAATGITAPFLNAGTETVNWRMSTFDVSGSQVPFASGSTTVNVIPPDVTFDTTFGTATPIATVTHASVGLTSTGADRCALTTDLAKANVPGIDKPCLVEWTSVPPGLEQDGNTTLPSLVGVFTQVGAQAVSFDVSYYDVAGVKRVLLSATKPVPVDPPPMPAVVLKNSREISPGLLTAPVSGGNLATLILDVTKWPMDAEVKWSDQSFAQTYRISPLRNSQLIPVTEAPLWSRRQVTIKLFLRAAPDLFVEKTFDVISVPVDAVKFTLDNLPTTAADSIPLQVSARIDMTTRTGPLYDGQTMGQWSVQFGLKDGTGMFVPQGAPVLTDANGVATSSVDVFGLTLARVLAQATAVSPEPSYTRMMESATKMSTVVKGTPIDGTIVVKGLSEGPAPFVAILRVAFNTRSDQLANESVTWQMSADAGSTWTPLDATGLQVIQRLGEGRYLVKAIFTNRNTHVVSEAPPVPLAVWAVPKIQVAGNTFEFPGAPATLEAKLFHPNGQQVQSGVLEWSVSRRVVLAPGETPPPPVATGTTPRIAFTASEAGQYMLTVRARMASSNPDDPRAWGTTRTQITYGAPEKPSVRVTGPVRAEVGKPYTFNLSVRTRFDLSSSSLKLGGAWTLPDGRTVPSLEGVTYTPTLADLAVGEVITLKYQGWVVGYEDSTTATASVTLPIWKYVWPDWRVVSSTTSSYAPTSTRLTALPSDLALLPTLEGLAYTWTVPPTARILSAPSVKLDAVVDFGGTHPFSVVISDARGNSTALDTSITVQDAKPYVVDLTVSNMSKWSHAPLTLGVAPRVSGGHPLDAITSWKYFLDGVPLDLANKNTAIIPVDAAGDHTVEVRVASRMGATATKLASVTVPNNQPPSCGVSAVPSLDKRFVVVQAKCADPDGAIVKYAWSVNGIPQPFSNGVKWTYIVQPGVTYPLTIDLSVIDDGGLTSTASATAN